CPTYSHNFDYESMVLGIVERIESLVSIALIDKAKPSKHTKVTLSYLIESYPRLEEEFHVSADDVACILTTSGTTGKPKEVLLTHNNLIFSERSFTQAFGRTERDVMFMPSPLNHATGFFHGMLAPMILGGRTILMQDFNAKDAITLMNAEGATWSMGATPFIYDILKHIESEQGNPLKTLELFLCGGAPVPSSLVQRAARNKVLLCEIYGSTESCPHVYVPPKHCLEWNGAWSGIPFEGIEVRAVDENRREVARGEQGEECSRGPHQFVGYYNDPERTDRVLDEEGWFFSGDLCYIDAHNRIRISGRKKEIIIRGGENICAGEIDEYLEGCPGVGQHATIGMPDKRLGERICTFVVVVGNAQVNLGSVIAYLSEKHVARRLWPERIELIDTIPTTATGKVKRFLLAEELKLRMQEEETDS
ncbi:MAG: AMP-binding protein, partial [Coriobacteriaceae bacterium]|nr:AMP-binding protein [Coriobacteriaceae bacterium]